MLKFMHLGAAARHPVDRFCKAVGRFTRDQERKMSREQTFRQVLLKTSKGVDRFLLNQPTGSRVTWREKRLRYKPSDRFFKGVDRFLEISGGPRTLYLSTSIEVKLELDRWSWSPEITQLSSQMLNFSMALSFGLIASSIFSLIFSFLAWEDIV